MAHLLAISRQGSRVHRYRRYILSMVVCHSLVVKMSHLVATACQDGTSLGRGSLVPVCVCMCSL